MLNFSAPDLTVDATNSTRVDANSRSLCNVFANSHIAAKDTIKGVINVNKDARSKLSQGRSHTCHNGRWDVDSVLADGVIVPLYI